MPTAARAIAGTLFAVALAAGLPGAAPAQESLTPAQKAERVLYGYDRYGAKYSYGPVSEENGVLKIRNLKYEVAVPWQEPKNPDAPKKTETFNFTAETIVVRRYDYRNPELPHFADVTFRGIRPGGSLLDRFGWDRAKAVFGGQDLVLDVSQAYELDRPAGSLDQKAFAVTLRDLLRFDLTGRFDGLDFAGLTDPKLLEKLGSGSAQGTGSDAAVRMVFDLLGDMRVHRLSYALTDLGGIDKMLAVMAAAQSKQNPDGPKITAKMLRQGFAGGLAGAGARFSGSFAPKLLESAARWLLAPGTLTIALKPGRPLPVAGIVGYIGAFSAQAKQAKGQKLDLDPLQKFFGLSVSYAPAAR